jgi:Domain of unknown function (DUF397)
MADVTRAMWRKSSYSSGNGGNCVEVCAAGTGTVAVRDSKDVTGPELEFTGQAWTDFVLAIKSGDLGL